MGDKQDESKDPAYTSQIAPAGAKIFYSYSYV